MKCPKSCALMCKGVDLNCPISNSLLLIARVFLGLTMAFSHGFGKIPPSDGFVGAVAGLGFPLPVVFAWFAGLSEFAGGIMVALGAGTRLGALMVSGTMLVAAFGQHWNDPFAKKEFALVYMAAFIIILAVGAGKYSVDYYCNKKCQ